MYFTASSFRTCITRKAPTAGVNSMEGNWHSLGLGALAWKERLWVQVCFSWEKGQLVGSWEYVWPQWWMESWSLHSNVWVESKRQWHKLKQKRLRLVIRKNLLPMRMVQQWGWVQRVLAVPSLAVWSPDWVKPRATWSDSVFESALNRGQQFLADWFILSWLCSDLKFHILWNVLHLFYSIYSQMIVSGLNYCHLK